MRCPVSSVGVKGIDPSPLSFLLRLFECCCLRESAQVVRDGRPVSSRLRVNCNCASQLKGLLLTPLREMSKCYMFSHLFNSRKLKLGLELEHECHSYAKDGIQVNGGLCVPVSL